jgi:glycosyltransferase involved in cell wall biosynthesis
MHIWIVSNGEPLPLDAGSPRLRRMGMLAQFLQEQNNEVDWFSSTFHHYLKIQRAAADSAVTIAPEYRIQLIHAPGYPDGVSLARVRHQRIMGRQFTRIAGTLPKPDIIVATLAPLPLSDAAVSYGRVHRIPVIIDIRDLWPDIFLERIPGPLQPLGRPYLQIIRRGVGKTLAQASGLWGVTADFLQYGLDLAGRTHRSTDGVFHTSYPRWALEKALVDFPKHWASHGLSAADFLVVFLGSFSRQFILGPVWEAARLLQSHQNIRFVLCGSGPLLAEAQAMAKTLDNITVPGWVNEPAIHSLLATAGAGLAPYASSQNFIRNTPNKFSEYLSADLPVLVNIPGTMAGLLEEYTAGSRYRDGGELAQQITRLADDASLRRQQREGAARLYEEHFRADKVLTGMVEHLHRMVP